MGVLQEIAEDLRQDSRFANDILEPLEILGVDQFTDSAVMIKCRIKTEPLKQWRVGREMNRRIKNTFDAKGIEIPFPHQAIYGGEPKKGTPQPT
jgi:small conductance mechanosensitive channel